MKIVLFGGGTGLSNILTGFRHDVGKEIKKLTAVVTVSDSGGSSGILKSIYDIPAVGDLRNCLLALSNIENYVKKAMQYRFTQGDGLKGHPLGNLFLVALLETEGNILKAVKKASRVLNISGEIFPATFDKTELVAIFNDQTRVSGEAEIINYALSTGKKIVSLEIYPENPRVPRELLQRIKSAEILIFGPGSLYTSVLPNLLIKEIREAIENSKSLKILINNLLTQPGETNNFTASEHLREFLRISRLSKIDIFVLNNGQPTLEQKRRMKAEGKKLVKIDLANLKSFKTKYYIMDLVDRKSVYLKHDPRKLRTLLFKIAKEHELLSFL